MATLVTPSSAVSISAHQLSLDEIIAVARHGQEVALSDDSDFRRQITRGREALEHKLAEGEVVYGVNTGFGSNARYVIPNDELAHHQQRGECCP